MIDKNYIAISSLSMDLKRVALGYYNGSFATAQRFSQEALKRSTEVDKSGVKPYIKKLIHALPGLLKEKDKMGIAENALMYSTILQNYIRVK